MPDGLEFLLLVVGPAAAEMLLLVLAAPHLPWEVPAPDYAFHAPREEVPLALHNGENRARVLPHSSDALDLFTRFLSAPDLHG